MLRSLNVYEIHNSLQDTEIKRIQMLSPVFLT